MERSNQLRDGEALGILDSITDGFLALDPAWRLIYVNAAAERSLGVGREDILGHDYRDVFAGAAGTIVERENRRAMEQRIAVEYETFWAPRQRWFAVKVYPTERGGISIYFRDTTEKREADEQLRQWRRFDAALWSTPDFIYTFDPSGRFSYANRALLALWQIPLADAIGKTFTELGYPPDLAQRLERQIHEVVETKATVRDETPFTGPSGETRHYEYIFVPVFGPDGARVESVAGSTRDITERRQAEEELRKSKERLNLALAAGGGVGTWDWDVVEDRVYCDARFADLLSMDPEEAAAGAALAGFVNGIHPGDRDRVGERIRQAVQSGDSFAEEYRVVQKGGAVRWVYARGRCHHDANGKPVRFPGVVFDITERKMGEEALRESEARVRFLAETIPQMVWTATADGALDYLNTRGAEYFDAPAEELLGGGWLSKVHPEDQEETVERWRQALATGESYETAFRLKRASDASWRWHLVRALPMVDERDGRITRWFGTCTDIADQRQTEEQLRKTNRELEEFAYVASHDLQEPLRMVNIYTQLLIQRFIGEQPDAQQFAGFVSQGVSRMEVLIRDLLTFSRTVHDDDLPVGEANLAEALAEALSVLEPEIKEKAAVVTAPVLPAVHGDTAQMSHVFQNLLSNALKYSKPGVAPEIRICAEVQGKEWIISVRDNGIGFDPQYAARIFGLFKRLHKHEYPGTGLGLAICKRIVERYGGRIWAQSQAGEGSTFSFALPRVRPQ